MTTTKQQPFCWATELATTTAPVTLSVKDARDLSAEMQRKTAEIEALRKDVDHQDAYAEQLGRDLSKAHAETIALQSGYAAARLEVESLHAQLEAIGAGGVEPLRGCAQAAPAAPAGEIVVTKNEQGQIVAVTRQDKEGRVLSIVAESSTPAEGDALDTERLDWLTFNLSGKALRDIGVLWSEYGDARRAIDAAMAAARARLGIKP